MNVGLLVQYSSQKFCFGKIRPNSIMKIDFEYQNFEMFEKLFHNFGNSDNDMIYCKNAYFQ